jgi:predicted dehydrogenase
MIRIAVLDCGRIGAMHAANIAEHPNARLAAVQDINSAAAQAAAASTGARVMDTAAEVFPRPMLTPEALFRGERGVEGICDYLDVKLAQVVF